MRWIYLLTLLVGVGLLTAAEAEAKQPYGATWQSVYTTSLSADNVLNGTGKDCQLCHSDTNGGDGWNTYGWAIRLEIDGGASLTDALGTVEALNSDSDPTSSSNLDEIQADSQPGWTDGANNTIYFKDLSTLTAQNPPAAIEGDLDPVPPKVPAMGGALRGLMALFLAIVGGRAAHLSRRRHPSPV
jgi:hypothetical protein